MRIAIVGGGLGGLVAALFLRKVGLDATVERLEHGEARPVDINISVPTI